jgi:molybdenum cofactor cytidylyltransferase
MPCPISAIVLTGGKSERMGQPKALLRYKGQTFLERILSTIQSAGIDQIVTVVGHHRSEISAAFPNVPLIFNPDYEQGMSTSVKAGIRAVPGGAQAIGIFLVDHPLISSGTIAGLVKEVGAGKIVVPSHEGRRGHPVFFPAELFSEILALGADEGLNVVVRRDLTRLKVVPVNDMGVLQDIDTPEQFENLLRESR